MPGDRSQPRRGRQTRRGSARASSRRIGARGDRQSAATGRLHRLARAASTRCGHRGRSRRSRVDGGGARLRTRRCSATGLPRRSGGSGTAVGAMDVTIPQRSHSPARSAGTALSCRRRGDRRRRDPGHDRAADDLRPRGRSRRSMRSRARCARRNTCGCHDRSRFADLLERYPRRRGAQRSRDCLDAVPRAAGGRARSGWRSGSCRSSPRRSAAAAFNAWLEVRATVQVDCLGAESIVELDGVGTRHARRARQLTRPATADRALAVT